MKNIIIIIQNILISILSILFFKSNKIIVIGSRNGDTFLDNPRYLYLYLYKVKEKFNLDRIFWVTSNKELGRELTENGFEVLIKGSLKSIYYHLKSKYHIVDQGHNEIDGKFSLRAVRIKLWHGIPLKKIGTLKKKSKRKNYLYKKLKSVGCWHDSYLLSPSSFTNEIFEKAFEVSKEKIITGGYPRNDIFFDDYYMLEKERVEFNKLIEAKNKGKKILFYLPTFRDNYDFEFLGESSEKKILNFLDFLEKNDMLLVVKPHPHDPFSINNPKIIKLKSDFDLYTFLEITDVLITDYSSVYFDFLNSEKPIIFYPYDLEKYEKDRGLIFSYNDYTPGKKSFNLKELEISLMERDLYKKERDNLKNKVLKENNVLNTVESIFKIGGRDVFKNCSCDGNY